MFRVGNKLPDGTIIGARGQHALLAPDNPLNRWLAQTYTDRFSIAPIFPAYHMAQSMLGLKVAWEKAQAKKGGARPSPDEVIAAFEGIEVPTPSGSVRLAIGKGHQGIADTAYGAFHFNKVEGKPELVDIVRYPAECVGSFYAFGAFGAASAVGIYFEQGWPVAGGFLMMVLVAMGIGLVLGLIIERGLLRLVYGRDEVIVVLVTFSASLILEDMILLIWGTRSYPLYQPLAVAGNFDVGSLVLSGYDMGLIALAAVLAVGAHWALKYTRDGGATTVIPTARPRPRRRRRDPRDHRNLCGRAMLGALGGASMGRPKISATPGIGVEVIVLAFAVGRSAEWARSRAR